MNEPKDQATGTPCACHCYVDSFTVTFGSGKCHFCGSWLVGGTCDNRCELKDVEMLDPWSYVWNKFNEAVMNDFAAEEIDELEMERRLDSAEATSSVESLVKVAKQFGYEIRIPKSV
jgi:hypothetical protein